MGVVTSLTANSNRPHFSVLAVLRGRVVLCRVVIVIDGALARVHSAGLLVQRDATADRQRQEELEEEDASGDAKRGHHVEPIVLPDEFETVTVRAAFTDITCEVEERLVADATAIVLLFHLLEELEATEASEVLEEVVEARIDGLCVFRRVNDVIEALCIVADNSRLIKVLGFEEGPNRRRQEAHVDLVSAGVEWLEVRIHTASRLAAERLEDRRIHGLPAAIDKSSLLARARLTAHVRPDKVVQHAPDLLGDSVVARLLLGPIIVAVEDATHAEEDDPDNEGP